MKKYNYFDDNDVDNSIYDREDDIYNIAKSIRERIASQDANGNIHTYEEIEQEQKKSNHEKNSNGKKEKLTLSDFKQKLRDGELFHNISWTNIRNSLHFKDTRLRVALPIIIVTMLAICIGSFVYDINISAKKSERFSIAAGGVCAQKTAEYGFCGYEKLNEKYGKDVNRLVGLCFARELDFDNDGKSELLICYNDGGVYFNEIYGFDKHKDFVSLYKKPVCTVKDITHGDFMAVYHKNNKYFIAANEELEEDKKQNNDNENSNVQGIVLYGLSGNSFKEKYDFDYDYVNEAFSKKGKVDLDSFEKIKLSCIKYHESERRIAQTSKVINGFDTNGVQLNTTNDTNHRMMQAYFKLVMDYNAKYGSAKLVEEDGNTALSGLSVVKQVDFNGDSVNELMLIYRKEISKRSSDKKGNYISIPKNEYFCEIYKWTGEKAVRVFRSDCISSKSPNGADSLYIIKKNGDDRYYCENSHISAEKGKVVTSTSKIYQMADLNFNKTYELVKKHSYGHDSFYHDGKSIRKKDFYSDKDNVALFLTEDGSYDIKLFDVGYVKRQTENKTDVENQLKSTIAEIQKLNKQYVHE